MALPFVFSQQGTWVTCGAYALIHALQARHIDLLELENSTGVTFGLASLGADNHFARMLTPFRTFWTGMLPAARLWGLEIRLYSFPNPTALGRFLYAPLPDRRLVLGPISMAGLRYLPLASQFRCADHYIALRQNTTGGFILTDSEGMAEKIVTAKEIAEMCSITDIPEAGQVYNVGVVNKIGSPEPQSTRLKYTARLAEKNFQAAELAGQGSQAILLCLRAMEATPIQNWREPVLYELSYLIQRKEMLMQLTADLLAEQIADVSPLLLEHVDEQIALAARIRRCLGERDTASAAKYMTALAKTEKTLAHNWGKWVKLK